MGLKTEAKAGRRRRPRCACVPGSDGVDRHRRPGDAAGSRDRLPRPDQGRRRRRRQGDARLPRRVQPRGRAPGGPQRGRGRLQERQRLPREVHRPAPARRGPDPGRYPRQHRPLLGPRLHAAAPASEARRGIARPDPAPQGPHATRRSRRPARQAPPATSTRAPASSWSTPRINFYFIEVNARIQVEHPVTEMVTGIDLVKQQIKIAAGEPLPFRQDEIVVRGPLDRVPDQFRGPRPRLPPLARHRSPRLRVPGGPGVRWDSHIQVGYTVPPNYDSLVGKLIVHAPTRTRGPRHHAARPRRAGRSRESARRSRSTAGSSATPTSSPGKSIPPGSSGSSCLQDLRDLERGRPSWTR